jgi:hypothetical protein
MVDPNPWASLPPYWLNVPLPGVRQGTGYHTYESSRQSDLPPIPIELMTAATGLRRMARFTPSEDSTLTSATSRRPLWRSWRVARE